MEKTRTRQQLRSIWRFVFCSFCLGIKTGLVRSEAHSLNTGPTVPIDGMRWPAALKPGTRLGILILQDGTDQRVTPTARSLVGSDYETDHDWHASTMRYIMMVGLMIHDPTWCQHKRAKPTQTDPEDDTQVDPTMQIGSTSKTWSPRADD